VHVLLVTNPKAGSAGAVDPAAVLVERGCTVTVVDIAEAASWSGADGRLPASARGIERVVVAGGDGSIGCAAVLARRIDVPLGVVPAGTANDFARAVELPTDLERATVLAATGEQLREVDLARVDDQPFVNVASVGLAPKAAEKAKPLKGGLKALAYPIGAAAAAITSRPMSVVATVDGETAWSGKAWQAMVASTGAFGGWAQTGRTEDGDRQLDLVVIPAGRGMPKLAVDAAALMRGELADREGVHHARGRRIELTLRHAPRIVVDGELIEVDDRHVAAHVEGVVRVVTG
jgi:diacylglycerol kinase family enzyme